MSTNATQALTIVELTARNVKRISAVRIRPQCNLVKITGKNDQGKTSVLDCIWLALGGKAAGKGMPKPIRNGESTAETTLRLSKTRVDEATGKTRVVPGPGDLIVTRKWTATDSYLTVATADGAPIKSPQTLLDRLCGDLSFDPLAFTKMDSAKQIATLKAVAGLDFSDLDAYRAKAYSDRTMINRQVERLEGQLAGMPVPDAELPAEEVSVADLLAKQEEASTVERERVRLQAEKDSKVRGIEDCKHGIDRAKDQIARLTAEITRLAAMAEAFAKEYDAIVLPEPVDVGDVREQLATIEETNAQVRQARDRRRVQDALDEENARSRELTERIEAIDQEKRDLLAKAEMPIAGLGLSDDGVTYDGIPFTQVSSSGQLKVSLAMAIALNPTIRVIRITDGSLLDDANMQVVRQMAQDHQCQVWIEVVDDQDGDGWVIEDGEVKAKPLPGTGE